MAEPLDCAQHKRADVARRGRGSRGFGARHRALQLPSAPRSVKPIEHTGSEGGLSPFSHTLAIHAPRVNMTYETSPAHAVINTL